MKICVINNIYPPFHRGGAEQVVVKTIEGLLAKGHHIVLITASPEGESIEKHKHLTVYRILPKNIYFYTDAHKHHLFTRLLWQFINLFHLGASRKIKNILNKEKPDVVHTHNLMGLSFLIPSVIRALELVHVHTVHDVQLVEPSGIILKEEENTWRYNGIFAKSYTAMVRLLMKSPDVVISPSHFLLNFYKERGFFTKSKKVVIRNPLTFEVPLDKNLDHTQTNPMKLLYVGQIEDHKGVMTLIEAFSQLEKNGAELHVVGNGSLLSKIKERVKHEHNIKIHGRMERKELAELFSSIDMTIVPSLCYENSPTVIFESFAFNVPVLASNIEGVAELIEEGKNGLTFQAGNIEALLTSLNWVINHPEEIFTMRKEANLCLKKLHADSYIDSLLNTFKQLMLDKKR